MSKIEVNTIEPQCGTTLTVGASGDTITFPTGTTIVNNGTQTGFGRTGTVDWDTTPKTSTVTAANGVGYFVNTTAGVITVNLPAGSAGNIVSLSDYAATWQTNAVTVSPNGAEKIGSINADVTLNTEGQSVTFVYVDGTQGWINVQDSTSNVRGSPFLVATGGTITTSGNCKIHTFTGPGTFTVSSVSTNCAAENVVSYAVLAGGASGGNGIAGGGGAGGFREVKSPITPYTASPLDGYPSAPNRITVTAAAFPITVGAGGATNAPGNVRGLPGNNSIFSSITSTGGGAGAGYSSSSETGGSGGGGAGLAATSGAAGNTPPVSPSQGNNGGNGSPGGDRGGGGGGGATAAGANSPSAGVAGGAGATTSISASPTAYAGGGGSGSDSSGGPGGIGGGGSGGGGACTPGNAATTNTGGGGGGAGPSGTGGTGGSGIVIIRYKFQ